MLFRISCGVSSRVGASLREKLSARTHRETLCRTEPARGGREGVLPQGGAELEHARMLLGLACLPRSRSPRCDSFACALAVMVPPAQSLKVIELVIVAGLYVVDLIRGHAAE